MSLIKILTNHVYFKNLIKIKFEFKPPEQVEILIYDNTTTESGYTDILFKKKKKISFFNRFEKINIFILYKSLINRKYSKLIKNYVYHYFNHVKPKIIYTSIDNNPAFYLLKHIYPNAIYISDQNGMRDNLFYSYCKNQIKLKKKNFLCDYYFVFGDYENKRMKKIINGKIISSGNSHNNFYSIKKQKKRKIITYISSKIYLRPELEKKIFKKLIKFSQKFNYKLFYLDRPRQNNKNLLTKAFESKNWNYLQTKSRHLKYKILSQSKLVTFAHSTLGYELLSRGSKCVAFNHQNYNYSNLFKVKKNGKFWCDPDKYSVVEKKLNEVINYSDQEWKNIIKKNATKIMYYDKNNKIKKKIIDKILNG